MSVIACRLLGLLAALCLPLGARAQAGVDPARPVIAVHAAGSLRAVMTDLAQDFERTPAAAGAAVRLTFGASGLLKDRIAGGEPAQVFASANMEHPEALRAAGKAESVEPFARNALCALSSPTFGLQGRGLVARLLDADVRLAISTPKADPAGDYAFAMFERVESTGTGPAGSAAALKARAQQLTGGPQHPPPPAGRNVYGVLMAEGRADVFITYCTNARQAAQEVPGLQVIDVPAAVNVSALYGMATLRPVTPAAQAFVRFVQGDAGQAVLRRHGFAAP